jgi:nucleoid-associated protein
MELRKLVIHEVRKGQNSNVVDLILSEQDIPINPQSTELVSALVNAYKRDKAKNGRFDNNNAQFFASRFYQYNESNKINEDFISFSTITSEYLRQILLNVYPAKGGYLVFAEYLIGNFEYISVFLVRDTEGKTFERENNTFVIRSIEYLDTNNLAMAARINLNLLNSEDNYISFTSHKQDEVSNYFINWVGVSTVNTNKELTDKFNGIINNLPRPIDPESGIELELYEVKSKIFEVVKANQKKEINIEHIGDIIYGNPDIIKNYIEDHQIALDTVFRYDSRSLKKFVQIHVNRDGINIKFSRGDVGIGKKIWVSEQDENMIIINSNAFASELRNQIEDNG